MPLYDYECDGPCGTVERFQSIRDDALTTCPDCGCSCRRLISLPSGAMEQEYRKPIELHSVAPVTREEQEAFKRRNPGVDFGPGGVPLAHTRKQKLSILRNEGFEEKN